MLSRRLDCVVCFVSSPFFWEGDGGSEYDKEYFLKCGSALKSNAEPKNPGDRATANKGEFEEESPKACGLGKVKDVSDDPLESKGGAEDRRRSRVSSGGSIRCRCAVLAISKSNFSFS
jgi:hypothetical protein